jgi:hypothetical protein
MDKLPLIISGICFIIIIFLFTQIIRMGKDISYRKNIRNKTCLEYCISEGNAIGWYDEVKGKALICECATEGQDIVKKYTIDPVEK